MTSRYGIDTSVLVRLVTTEPTDSYQYCIGQLSALVRAGAEVLASNQVIGESYIAVQLHYGVSKDDARTGLMRALRSGLVAPLNGDAVFDSLAVYGGAGLFDRLIADDYQRAGLEVITLDRRMAGLPNVRRI